MTTSSGKHFQDNSYTHIVSLLYKLITLCWGIDDLSIGFDRDCGRRRDELTNNKIIKVKSQLRIMLRDVFGLAENQEKVTYKLTLTRKKDETVLEKAHAGIKNDHIHWYVLHYTPSIQ